MHRVSILETASEYVTKDRAATHGDAKDNFSVIAGLWSAYAGVILGPADVAAMMALLKIARIKSNPAHLDNWIDGAGYFACGGEIATGEVPLKDDTGRGALWPDPEGMGSPPDCRYGGRHHWVPMLDSNGPHRQCRHCGVREYDL